MLDWLMCYFAEVKEVYDEVKAREDQAQQDGDFFAEFRMVAVDSAILYFAPIPPVAKAIRWKLLGI